MNSSKTKTLVLVLEQQEYQAEWVVKALVQERREKKKEVFFAQKVHTKLPV
jgi:hypothetical protein